MKNVCAVIVTYNSDASFKDNLQSIYPQLDHIFIVDNNSCSETLNILKDIEEQFSDKITIIYNEKNLGLAAAQNMALKYSVDYKWVLLLDDDSKPKDDMVATMLASYEEFEDKENVAIVGANFNIDHKYLISNDNITFKYKTLKEHQYLDVLYNIASGSLIKTCIFDKVGFFKDNFFIDYIDFEFCLRLVSLDYRIMVIRSASFSHELGAASQHQLSSLKITTYNHSPLRRFYIFRNRIWCWKLYYKKIPAFVINDFMLCFYQMLKIAVLEKNKLASFKSIFKGIIAGISNKHDS